MLVPACKSFVPNDLHMCKRLGHEDVSKTKPKDGFVHEIYALFRFLVQILTTPNYMMSDVSVDIGGRVDNCGVPDRLSPLGETLDSRSGSTKEM